MITAHDPSEGRAAFGALLLQHRRAAGLSQADLARSSGMSVRALRELERGRANAAQARSAEVLADALNLDERERRSFLILAKEGRRRHSLGPEIMALCALPSETRDLVGREHELEWLRSEAARGGVVAIVGHPGVGKTSLAISAAHGVADEFPDRCLALDLKGGDEHPMTPLDALDSLLRAAGVSAGQIPPTQEERSNLLRVLLASKRILLLLDNVADEAQVRPLMLSGPGCLTLMTSRGTLAALEGVRRLWLAPLEATAAVQLLTEIAGADRVMSEPENALELVNLCGSLPLAMRIVGNRLATRPHWTIAYLVAQLRDERARLDLLSIGDLQVRSAFEVSYRRLSSAARTLFRRLAVVPGAEFGEEMARVVLSTDTSILDRYLNELADASLLQPLSKPGRFRFHDLLRIFAGQRMEMEDEPGAPERYRTVVLRHLLDRATAAARMFLTEVAEENIAGRFQTASEAAEWLVTEKANWIAAQRVAAGLGWHHEVLEFSKAMHWYTDNRIPDRPWDQIFELGLHAARALDSQADEAKLLNQLGWAHYMCLGANETALPLYAEALEVAEEVGDLNEQAWAHAYLAFVLVRLGRVDEGVLHARQCDDLAIKIGFPGLRLSMRNVAALVLRSEGRFEEALELHRAVLSQMYEHSTSTNLSKRWMTAVVQDEIGQCLTGLERWEQAAETHREARTIFAEHGIGYREGRAALLEGMAWRAAGDLVQARKSLEVALTCLPFASFEEEHESVLQQLALINEGD